MNPISSFTNWWKTASAQASVEHYQLRFNENELNEMRRGTLGTSAREKITLRLQGYKKMTMAILIGCFLPILLFVIPFFLVLGYAIYRRPPQIGFNPVTVCFGAFCLFVITFLIVAATGGLTKLQTFRRRVAADLQNNRVGLEQGRVNVKVISTRNGFRIEYRMNGLEYNILNDAIGSEIHHHFFGGPVIGRSFETAEIYRFYFLPQSKLLLHFEQA